MVFLANRLIQVLKFRFLRSIFWVFLLPVLLQTQTIPSKIRSPAPISSFMDEIFWPPFPKRYNPSGCSLARQLPAQFPDD